MNKKRLIYSSIAIIMVMAISISLYIFYPRDLGDVLNYKLNLSNDIGMNITKTNYFEDTKSVNYMIGYETNSTDEIASVLGIIEGLKVSRTFKDLDQPAKHSAYGFNINIYDKSANKVLIISCLDPKYITFISSHRIFKYKFEDESVDLDYIENLLIQ